MVGSDDVVVEAVASIRKLHADASAVLDALYANPSRSSTKAAHRMEGAVMSLHAAGSILAGDIGTQEG